MYDSPGRLWSVALTIVSAGSGMLPFSFTCVFPAIGVTTRQVFFPSMVVAVWGTGDVDTPGRLAATADGESTLKQTSSTVLPLSTPPPIRMPRGSRASRLTPKKSFVRFCLPKCEDCVTSLDTRPNCTGVTSASPQTWYPPPFGNRESLGAVDRKSTRLNSSHLGISYAVFC